MNNEMAYTNIFPLNNNNNNKKKGITAEQMPKHIEKASVLKIPMFAWTGPRYFVIIVIVIKLRC